MRRFLPVVRRLARNAPSLSALAFVGLSAPYVTQRLFALEHEPARARLATLVIAFVVTTCAAGLATLVLGAHRKGARSWLSATLAPLAMLVVGCVVISARAPRTAYDIFDVLGPSSLLSAGPTAIVGLVVLADTIRRPRIADRDFAVRVATAVFLMFIAPLAMAMVERPFSWACFSETLPAEGAAWSALDATTRCAATHGTAAVLVLGLVGDRARRRRTRATLLPLAAMGLWLLGAAFVDGIGIRAARLVHAASADYPVPGAPIDAHTLEGYAIAASIVGGTCAAIAMAAWGFSATIVGLRVPRATLGIGWRVLAPLAPALMLAASGVTNSPLHFRFPQQLPRAVWNEVDGFRPLTRVRREQDGWTPFFWTDSDDMVVALLTTEPTLEIFRNGHRGSTDHWMLDPIVPPHNHFWTEAVHLMPDARATFGHLRASLRALRRFGSIALVWRYEDLDEAPLARERWAFAEMGGRGLRARTFELFDLPEDCHADGPAPPAGVHGRWCPRPEGAPPVVDPSRPVFVAEEPDDVVLGAWLDSVEGLDGQVVLRAPRREYPSEREALDPSATLPPDEVFHRLAPHESPWALIGGALAGIAMALVIAIGRSSKSRWAVEALAWLRIAPWTALPASDGGPYRTREPAPRDHAPNVLGRRCVSAALHGLDVLRRWVFAVVVVAGAAIAIGLFA